jgi:hypothetical protein
VFTFDLCNLGEFETVTIEALTSDDCFCQDDKRRLICVLNEGHNALHRGSTLCVTVNSDVSQLIEEYFNLLSTDAYLVLDPAIEIHQVRRQAVLFVTRRVEDLPVVIDDGLDLLSTGFLLIVRVFRHLKSNLDWFLG